MEFKRTASVCHDIDNRSRRKHAHRHPGIDFLHFVMHLYNHFPCLHLKGTMTPLLSVIANQEGTANQVLVANQTGGYFKYVAANGGDMDCRSLLKVLDVLVCAYVLGIPASPLIEQNGPSRMTPGKCQHTFSKHVRTCILRAFCTLIYVLVSCSAHSAKPRLSIIVP